MKQKLVWEESDIKQGLQIEIKAKTNGQALKKNVIASRGENAPNSPFGDNKFFLVCIDTGVLLGPFSVSEITVHLTDVDAIPVDYRSE
jgi:hypothetical protein